MLDRLEPALKQRLGIKPSIWIDDDKLRQSRDFSKEIPESVKSSAAFLLLPSPTYIRSRYCVDQECRCSRRRSPTGGPGSAPGSPTSSSRSAARFCRSTGTSIGRSSPASPTSPSATKRTRSHHESRVRDELPPSCRRARWLAEADAEPQHARVPVPPESRARVAECAPGLVRRAVGAQLPHPAGSQGESGRPAARSVAVGVPARHRVRRQRRRARRLVDAGKTSRGWRGARRPWSSRLGRSERLLRLRRTARLRQQDVPQRRHHAGEAERGSARAAAARPARASRNLRQATRVPRVQRARPRRAQERRTHQLPLPQGDPLRTSRRPGAAHAAALTGRTACCSCGETRTRTGARASSWRWCRRPAAGGARPLRVRSGRERRPQRSSRFARGSANCTSANSSAGSIRPGWPRSSRRCCDVGRPGRELRLRRRTAADAR